MPQDRQQGHGTLAVLHARRRDDDDEEEPERIDEHMALASVQLLGRVIAMAPPFSVVLTDWLSMMPALGCRCFPAATRTLPRSWSCMTCQVPSRCQRPKYW